MIIMNNQAQFKVDTITKVNEDFIQIRNAQKLLKKSRRTIESYLQAYPKIGFQFAVHKNKNKPPVNKTSEAIKRKLQDLIKEKYFDFNLCHLCMAQGSYTIYFTNFYTK